MKSIPTNSFSALLSLYLLKEQRPVPQKIPEHLQFNAGKDMLIKRAYFIIGIATSDTPRLKPETCGKREHRPIFSTGLPEQT
jgi:hypothetical protein